MEILESLGIDWKLLLGQIFNFLLILFLLKKFAYKPLLDLLKERTKKIQDGIKKSEKAQEIIQMVKEQKDKILKNAQEKASEVLKQNEERGKEKAEEIFNQATKEKEDILVAAKEQGKADIKKMRKEDSRAMLGLSFSLLEKILKEKINPEKDKEITEKFLSNLRLNKNDNE